jgi:F0F1-type ATP synthase membrane subunit c/vacuolar-type H+-ATPase subunit K
MDAPLFAHYSAAALCVALTSLGTGIGEGMAGMAAVKAMDIQPSARSEIFRANILGMALIETAAILGVVISLLLIFGQQDLNPYANSASLGIAFAIAIPGLVAGIVSAFPAQQACLAIARQPFFSQKIMTLMLVTQSIIQTSVIFGFIVAILIKNQSPFINSFAESLRLIGSGFCSGFGSIGPVMGLAHFAQTACAGIGFNRNSYSKILPFTLMSQAIIETPLIFALLISLLLLSTTTQDNILIGIAMMAASLCIGIGTLGPGIGSGRTAAAACQQIARAPFNYSLFSRMSLLGQGLIDTSAIYALLISLILIYFR